MYFESCYKYEIVRGHRIQKGEEKKKSRVRRYQTNDEWKRTAEMADAGLRSTTIKLDEI